MRKRVRFSKKVDIADPEKLNDDQAEQYLRYLWSSLDTMRQKTCLYVDPILTRSYYDDEDGRLKVLRRLFKDKFFERNYIFFPICLWNHWVLVILCNPNNDVRGGSERPTMLLLDSLKGSNSNNVEEFMRELLNSFFKYANRDCTVKNLNTIPFLMPEVPKQSNDKSCGFFVLFYITLFIKMSPPKFKLLDDYPSFMTRYWFNPAKIEEFRQSLLGILGGDSENDKINTEIQNLILSCSGEGNDISDCDKKRSKKQRVEHKKRVEVAEKNQEISVDSDEDVVVVAENNNSIVSDSHKLLMKMSPELFCETIENLSLCQKEWVSSTGFGSILQFELHSYPKYLSYSIVKNFVSESCSVVVEGKTLQITESDVQRVLGFPLGTKSIPFVKSDSLAKEWRRQYGDKPKAFRVAVKNVVAAIKDSTVADVNFKKNFISLLMCFFFQAPSNSYIRQKLLGFCCELDSCFNYNWCEFVIKCLKKSTKNWLRNTETRYYTGSLPFLLYFFLDHFIGKTCFSDKIEPRFVPWNNYSLDKLEQVMIQKSIILDGDLRIPCIDYVTLESCRIKGKAEDSSVRMDYNITSVVDEQVFSKEQVVCAMSDDVVNELDWDLIPKATTKGLEWNFNQENNQTSCNSYYNQLEDDLDATRNGSWNNSAGQRVKGDTSSAFVCKSVNKDDFAHEDKHTLLESLLSSYQSLQQTFLLHMLSAKSVSVGDDRVETLKKTFKDINDKANSLLD